MLATPPLPFESDFSEVFVSERPFIQEKVERERVTRERAVTRIKPVLGSKSCEDVLRNEDLGKHG